MSITKRSARSTVIVHEADFDTTIRLSLGAPSYGSGSDRIRNCDEIGTGVFARALWVGRKHVVLLTYSQWVDRNGNCTGDQYRLCDVDDVHCTLDEIGCRTVAKSVRERFHAEDVRVQISCGMFVAEAQS